MTTARLLAVEDDQDTLEVFTLWLTERYSVFGFQLRPGDYARPEAGSVDRRVRITSCDDVIL